MNYNPGTVIKTNGLNCRQLSQKGLEVAFFSSIAEARDLWQVAAPADNLFLRCEYLEVLAQNPPEGMSFCYLVFIKNKKPIGVSACQIQYFNIEQSINRKESNQSPCFFTTIGRYLKGLVASKVEFTTLICGTLLLTGEHGYYFKPGILTSHQAFCAVNESLDFAKMHLDILGHNIAGFLVKDFFVKTRNEGKYNEVNSTNEFTVEPNMILKVDPNWETFDDYMAAMTSKYRVRTKRAFKKAAALERKSFDESMIIQYQDRIFELYQMVAKNSGFNLISLNPSYLPALKRTLKDDFTLDGYFLNDQLIAFYTTIANDSELEAHFLGIDPEANRNYQIYINILYDIIRKGIERQSKKIVFARTATEIKSSVGALPHEMYCYMRHRNAFSNKFMTPILDYLKPEEDWVLRNPFKTPTVEA